MNSAPPLEYLNFLICKEMGWTHEELMRQPRSVVDQMITMMNIKAKFDARRNGRH